jgi:hypothetical protein
MITRMHSRLLSRCRAGLALVALVGLLGQYGPAGSAHATGRQPFLGSWRIYSARLFYDAGGATDLSAPTRQLTLSSNGRWRFGSSTGTWSVRPIRAADWQRWGSQPYGPTTKIVLTGWSRGTTDGPVEGIAGHVDFFWVIYHVSPPAVSDPGVVEIKFGRPNP